MFRHFELFPRGARTFILGLAYLGCSTALLWKALSIVPLPDPLSLGTMVTGLATGVGVVAWRHARQDRVCPPVPPLPASNTPGQPAGQ